MASSVTVIRWRGGPQVEVDQGRVISFAISMTFTLIANISSVKVRGHVSSSPGGGGERGGVRLRWGGGIRSHLMQASCQSVKLGMEGDCSPAHQWRSR